MGVYVGVLYTDSCKWKSLSPSLLIREMLANLCACMAAGVGVMGSCWYIVTHPIRGNLYVAKLLVLICAAGHLRLC